MELKSQFEEFLKNIRPTAAQKEDWATGHDTLRGRLMSDVTLKPIIINTFLQGSIRRSTAIRPGNGKRPDVDLVVVTKLNAKVTPPDAALAMFVPFLNKHYAGKWRAQDRSMGIELSYVDLDLVITALPSDQNIALYESLYGMAAMTTNRTLEDAPDWRLNEDWRPDRNILSQVINKDDNTDWKDHPLLLPDRQVRHWTRTHPLAQISWTTDKNKRTNGHYINVVRSTKWFRQEHIETMPKYPKGYPLEHFIGVCCPDGITSVAEGIVKSFEAAVVKYRPYAQANIVPELPDHGVPEHNVFKRLDPEHFRLFMRELEKAADVARRAFDHTDKYESAVLWNELFGSAFKVPEPSFTPPAGPANPQPTNRFA